MMTSNALLLSQLSDLVATRTGLRFPEERLSELEHRISTAARELGYKDTKACLKWLLSGPPTRRHLEILASYLTVGETYFFREGKTFEALENHVLPDLIRKRSMGDRRLRIWSAGCATGEEPYSVAILLNRMLPDVKDWNITILAIDINLRSLEKAQSGIYSDWSFRDCLEWVKQGYFKKSGNTQYEILPGIKKMVTFRYHNLAEDIYPSLLSNTNAMDIVFCRNVLMYFIPEQAKRTIQNYCHCLMDGGYLIVSPSELSLVSHPQLVADNLPAGTAIYRKDSQEHQTRESLFMVKAPSCAPLPSVVPMEPAPYHSDEQVTIRTSTGAGSEMQARYQEALTLYEDGHYLEAEKAVIGLLSQNHASAEALTLLARIHANQGRLREALACCQSAIAIDKLNPSCYFLMATILQERGQYREAAVSLKHALFLDPGFVPAHFGLGVLTRHQGRIKESRKYLENALLLLSKYQRQDIIQETEGMTAGRLKEIIRSMVGAEGPDETRQG